MQLEPEKLLHAAAGESNSHVCSEQRLTVLQATAGQFIESAEGTTFRNPAEVLLVKPGSAEVRHAAQMRRRPVVVRRSSARDGASEALSNPPRAMRVAQSRRYRLRSATQLNLKFSRALPRLAWIKFDPSAGGFLQ